MILSIKNVMGYCIIPLSIFLLSGCNDDKKTEKPYVVGYTKDFITENRTKHLTTIETQKIKSQTQKEIALIINKEI